MFVEIRHVRSVFERKGTDGTQGIVAGTKWKLITSRII